jgi:hypothetical protein
LRLSFPCFTADIGGAKGDHHEKPAQWGAECITLFVGVISTNVLLSQGMTVLLMFESPAPLRNGVDHRMDPFKLIPFP